MKDSKKNSLLSQLEFTKLVFIASIANIALWFSTRNYGSLIVSIIGIIAFILFQRQNSLYRPLTYFWVIIQLINIQVAFSEFGRGLPAFDFTQTYFKLNFGLEYEQSNGTFVTLNINWIAIFLFILFRISERMLLYWKPLSLYLFREDDQSEIHSLTGVLENKVFKNFGRKWLSVKTDHEIHLIDKNFSSLLIARKDKKLLLPFSTPQPVYVKLSEKEIKSSGKISDIDSLVLLQDLGYDSTCELAIASRIKIPI